jgi:hypothetical protein
MAVIAVVSESTASAFYEVVFCRIETTTKTSETSTATPPTISANEASESKSIIYSK